MSERKKCQFCTKSFQSQNDLDRHYQKYHNMKGEAVIMNDNPLSIASWAEEHNVDLEQLRSKQEKREK